MFGLVQHAPPWYGLFAGAIVVTASIIVLVWFGLMLGVVVPAGRRLWRLLRDRIPVRVRGEIVATPRLLAPPPDTVEGCWRSTDDDGHAVRLTGVNRLKRRLRLPSRPSG